MVIKFEIRARQPTEDGKNFTGLVGDLYNGFTDIGWANFFIRDDRRAIHDYTDTYRYFV